MWGGPARLQGCRGSRGKEDRHCSHRILSGMRDRTGKPTVNPKMQRQNPNLERLGRNGDSCQSKPSPLSWQLLSRLHQFALPRKEAILPGALRRRVTGQRQTTGSYREKQFPGSVQKESGPGIRIQTSKNLGWPRCRHLPDPVAATVTSDVGCWAPGQH